MHITVVDPPPRNVHSLHTNITGDLRVHSYVHRRVPRRKRAAKEQGVVAMTPDGCGTACAAAAVRILQGRETW